MKKSTLLFILAPFVVIGATVYQFYCIYTYEKDIVYYEGRKERSTIAVMGDDIFKPFFGVRKTYFTNYSIKSEPQLFSRVRAIEYETPGWMHVVGAPKHFIYDPDGYGTMESNQKNQLIGIWVCIHGMSLMLTVMVFLVPIYVRRKEKKQKRLEEQKIIESLHI
jgi:heme/copper-type cytochrome/quinol oxidase subunit 2